MTQKSHSKGAPFPPTTPGLLRLYSMRFCPFAHRTRLVLANKGIPFETINVDLQNKPEWLLERNPNGTVPVLELDGKVVYESTATSDWLDDVYTNTRLQPKDPFRRAWDRILFENFGKVSGAFFEAVKNPGEKEKNFENLNKGFKYFEDILAQRGGPFFGGSSPAMVDFLMWPHMERLPVIVADNPSLALDKKKFPKMGQWVDAMYARPEVKAIRHDDKTHIHFFETFKQGKPDYDYGLEE